MAPLPRCRQLPCRDQLEGRDGKVADGTQPAAALICRSPFAPLEGGRLPIVSLVVLGAKRRRRRTRRSHGYRSSVDIGISTGRGARWSHPSGKRRWPGPEKASAWPASTPLITVHPPLRGWSSDAQRARRVPVVHNCRWSPRNVNCIHSPLTAPRVAGRARNASVGDRVGPWGMTPGCRSPALPMGTGGRLPRVRRCCIGVGLLSPRTGRARRW